MMDNLRILYRKRLYMETEIKHIFLQKFAILSFCDVFTVKVVLLDVTDHHPNFLTHLLNHPVDVTYHQPRNLYKDLRHPVLS